MTLERRYILKRKIKAFFYGFVFYLCRVFPVDKNKIVFWTFEGSRGFCCNPRYIAEEVLKRNKNNNNHCKLVWLVDDVTLQFPKEIIKVKNSLWNRVYQLSTAKCWVGNSRTLYGTKKRKGQVYIQTWHGTICIKPIGKYRGNLFPPIAYLVSQADSQLTDYVLSGSAWCDDHYRDGLVYNGTIIRTGTPRCDVLINNRNEMRSKIRKMYGVPKDGNILLYAPTFRGGSQWTRRTVEKEEPTINLGKLLYSLEQRFGGQWFIFVRLHPQLAANNQHYEIEDSLNKVFDVTDHSDMNELIAASDAFISDYSSAIFEAALLTIPCFIYADDLEEYIKSRGDLFFDMYELPFPIAMNMESLIRNIIEFNRELYVRNLHNFMSEQNVTEDGHASENVVDLLECVLEIKEK